MAEARPAPIGRWVNERARREFAELDSELRREVWDDRPPVEADIETRFGSTRTYHWSGTGAPIVLLHGAGTGSLMWAPLLEHLRGRNVFAFDTIGDPGASVQRAPMRDARDVGVWLEETLDGLRLERAHLVGASYGGWIALHFARQAPHRAATLSVLDPTVEKVRPWFFVHGIACGIAMFSPAPVRHRLARPLRMNVLATDDRRIRRWGLLAQARYRRGAPRFTPVTDDELESIAVPTLVLLAEKSELHHSRRVLARARSLMRQAEVEMVPGTGHSLPVDQAAEVGTRLRRFLDGQTATAPGAAR